MANISAWLCLFKNNKWATSLAPIPNPALPHPPRQHTPLNPILTIHRRQRPHSVLCPFLFVSFDVSVLFTCRLQTVVRRHPPENQQWPSDVSRIWCCRKVKFMKSAGDWTFFHHRLLLQFLLSSSNAAAANSPPPESQCVWRYTNRALFPSRSRDWY